MWRDIVRSATKVTTAGGATIGRDSMGNRMAGRAHRHLPPHGYGPNQRAPHRLTLLIDDAALDHVGRFAAILRTRSTSPPDVGSALCASSRRACVLATSPCSPPPSTGRRYGERQQLTHGTLCPNLLEIAFPHQAIVGLNTVLG